MREEITDVLNRLIGERPENVDIADYFITVFTNRAKSSLKEIVGATDYSVYNSMHYTVEANTVRDDVLELVEAVLETL